MKVGFLNNQLDNRGTGNATFDYAFYNRAILRNESKIYTFAHTTHNEISVSRFKDTFGEIRYIRGPSDIGDIDVLYHIKYGNDDGFRIDPSIRYAVHAVFEIQPHGDRYAAVSNWLSRGRTAVVPHIVDPVWGNTNYREELGISEDAIVFGRHGGYDTFDIPWVWGAIESLLGLNLNYHFVFLNTQKHLDHPNVHYLEEAGPAGTRKFINTCNAMIHARQRGETFGISVGEFAVFGKPVFTWSGSGERAHIEELDTPYMYKDPKDLFDKMSQYNPTDMHFAYLQYSPNGVMKKFKEVFLDDNVPNSSL